MEFAVAWFCSVGFLSLMMWVGKDVSKDKETLFQGWVVAAWFAIGIVAMIVL